MAVGIRHADHVASSIRKKSALTSPTNCGRSRTQATEFSVVSFLLLFVAYTTLLGLFSLLATIT
jgi:hypothetical protein